MKKEKCIISIYGSSNFIPFKEIESTWLSDLESVATPVIVNSEFDAREERKFYVIYPPFKEASYAPSWGKEESCRKIECSNATPLYKWIAENDSIPGGIIPRSVVNAIREDYFSNWEVNSGKVFPIQKDTFAFEKYTRDVNGNPIDTKVFKYSSNDNGVIEFCKELNKLDIKENYFFNTTEDFGPTVSV